MTPDSGNTSDLALIQPVVLVGGKSTRFGSDKLRAPWSAMGEPRRLLVERPLNALRAVFGPRAAIVGECHPSIPPLADAVIPDQHPGIGPIGGIASALAAWGGPVFVLAGDMPNIAPAHILRILEAARARPAAAAVLASTDRLHPCLGLYRPSALNALRAAIARADHRLAAAISPGAVFPVPLDPDAAANINSPADFPPHFAAGTLPRISR